MLPNESSDLPLSHYYTRPSTWGGSYNGCEPRWVEVQYGVGTRLLTVSKVWCCCFAKHLVGSFPKDRDGLGKHQKKKRVAIFQYHRKENFMGGEGCGLCMRGDNLILASECVGKQIATSK